MLQRHSVEKYTNSCVLDHGNKYKIFTPIKMTIRDINNSKLNILKSTAIIDNLNSLPVVSMTDNAYELRGLRYNLVDSPTYSTISSVTLNKLSSGASQKIINIFTKLFDIKQKDNRILKIGKYKSGLVIEGQLLFETRQDDIYIDMLIRYVVSSSGIHYIKLEGYQITSDDYSNHYNYRPNVEIYSHPFLNGYHTDKTYMFSSNENKILQSNKCITRILQSRSD